jgi:hypothetical protein
VCSWFQCWLVDGCPVSVDLQLYGDYVEMLACEVNIINCGND